MAGHLGWAFIGCAWHVHASRMGLWAGSGPATVAHPIYPTPHESAHATHRFPTGGATRHGSPAAQNKWDDRHWHAWRPGATERKRPLAGPPSPVARLKPSARSRRPPLQGRRRSFRPCRGPSSALQAGGPSPPRPGLPRRCHASHLRAPERQPGAGDAPSRVTSCGRSRETVRSGLVQGTNRGRSGVDGQEGRFRARNSGGSRKGLGGMPRSLDAASRHGTQSSRCS